MCVQSVKIRDSSFARRMRGNRWQRQWVSLGIPLCEFLVVRTSEKGSSISVCHQCTLLPRGASGCQLFFIWFSLLGHGTGLHTSRLQESVAFVLTYISLFIITVALPLSAGSMTMVGSSLSLRMICLCWKVKIGRGWLVSGLH